MGILDSALIFYCKAAKQSCLYVQISLKVEGDQHLNTLLKIFRDLLKFDLTSKLSLLQVGGWTR